MTNPEGGQGKDYPRKDLQHDFQCEPGREDECCFFHNWLGGWVKCKLPQSDPIHAGEPLEVRPTSSILRMMHKYLSDLKEGHEGYSGWVASEGNDLLRYVEQELNSRRTV